MKKLLPARPSLEQLKNQAKTILKGHRAGDSQTLARIREHHPRWVNSAKHPIKNARFTLADAQSVLANEYGFDTWSKLKVHVRLHEPDPAVAARIESLRDAAGRGDVAQLSALLDAHPEIIDEPGGPGVRTALHQAVFGGQESSIRLLLQRGANPNIRCEGDSAYPLHFAAEKQHFPIIRLLIEHGADPVGEGDYHELGVLGWATAWEYMDAKPEIVDYLLAHGATHNVFSAVATGDVEAIHKLVSRSHADLERRMDLGNRRRRPLHLAVIKKQPGSLKALLDLGANTESLDEAGFTALDQAALDGETEVAKTLLERGAKVRLPAAIALHRKHDIEKLIRKDPDCLKPGGRWGNLIVRASERSDGPAIETLISLGASVNVRDNPATSVDLTSGYTPLHAAAFRGNVSAVSALLKHGANAAVREEKYHGTPAGWANYAGHIEVRDLILQQSVDIMEAVEHGLQSRVLNILAEDPEALNRAFDDYQIYPLYAKGWFTPLAFAVTLGKPDMVRLLLDQGADTMASSPDGQSINDLTAAGGQQEILKMLRERC